MADPFAPAAENPFDQIDPDMAAPAPAPPGPTAPESAGAPAHPLPQDNKPAAVNPFDDLGEVGLGPSSTTGSFARGAEKGVLPAAGSLAATGMGIEAGTALGVLAAPATAGWSIPIGAVGGALVGGFLGGAAVSYAQNWALKKMPDSWQDTLGVDDRQARLDEAQHPVASFLGGLAPFAVTMRPGAGVMKDLPENATALQRIMANPVTARLFGGAAMGGMELGTEAATQEHLDWRKVAISTAFGMVFNSPNKVGEAITEIGAHPARAALGQPHPTVAEAADLKVMGPGVTEGVFHGTQDQAPSAAMTAQENARVEHTLLGEPPEPDLHDIARRMEPDLFAKYDELIQRHETFRNWSGESPETARSHLTATEAEIREMGPSVAAAYRRAEETTGPVTGTDEQFPSFAAMLAAHEHGTGGVSRETNLPEMQGSAKAPAAQQGGGTVLPALQPEGPEGVRQGLEGAGPAGNGGPAPASAGVPLPQRTIGEQRSFIASDVTQKLVAAGRPPEEAAAAGQLLAARYVTRAGRFEGKLGSAEELYAREGAAIAGPNERPQVPAGAPAAPAPPANAGTKRGRAAADPKTWSLYEFLASEGGLKPTPDLVSIFGGKNPFVPGFGPLLRPTGLALDEALTRAKEQSYILDPNDIQHVGQDATRRSGELTVSVNDLHDLIAEESRGRKNYRTDHVPAQAKVNPEEERGAILDALHRELLQASGEAPKVDPALEDRVIEIIQKEGEHDVLAAYERAIMEDHDRFEGLRNDRQSVESIPGWDHPDSAPASGAGEASIGERGQAGISAEAPREDHGGEPRDASESHREATLAQSVDEYFQRVYYGDHKLDFEAGAEGKPQGLIPGVALITQRDLIQAAANKPMAPKVAQKSAGGLFGDSMNQKELFQSAYHGSPYHFDVFDTAHIGSGEGAAAYGHGLYFAENETVAKEYRDALSRSRNTMYDGGRPDWDNPVHVATAWLHNFGGDRAAAMKYLEGSKTPSIQEAYRLLEQNVPLATRESTPGSLYRVNIKPEPHEFLPWDKPVTDQAMLDKVKAAADKIKPGWYERLMGQGKDLAKWSLEQTDTPKTGQSIYGTLKRGLGSDKAASEALRDAGVPGIRYLDQGSRGNVNTNDIRGSLGMWETALRKKPDDAYAAQQVADLKAKLAAAEGGATHNYVVFDPKHIEILDRNGKPVSEAEYNQTARGKIRIAEGRRPIITLMKDANPSTFIHESGHQFLEELIHDSSHPEAPPGLRDDAQTVRDWLGVTDDIKTKHHEKFARGFEQYLREGVAPSPELAGVFAKFRNWLLSIYQSIKGLGTEISPEIRGVFDRMLEMEPQRTVVVPERASPTLLHDIHEAEAQHIEPHEAEGAMDRVVAERDRYIAEQPPEIQRGLETAVVKDTATQAPAAGAEGGPGAGGPSEVVADRGGPGAEPGGGAGSAESGTVKPGGGGAGAESAGVQRPDPRSKLGNDAGTALAPGPADLFGARESKFTDRAGNIRVENLTTRDDVAQAIRDAAAENNDFIGDRRGVVTDGQVMDLADALGMDVEGLVKRNIGQAFNAEQIMAARKLMIQSATEVVAAMKKAAGGTDEEVMAYAMAKDRHQMIQAQVAGITGEAGRALRAFRSIAGQETSTAVDQLIRQSTGKTLFQLRQEAQLGLSLDTPQQVSKFLHDAGRHSFGRMVLEMWINSILSGPATHATNIIGNTILAVQHFGPETAIASIVGRAHSILGREGTHVRLGELGAAMSGAVRGVPAAVQATGEAIQHGASTLLPGEVVKAYDIQPHNELAARGTLDEGATVRSVMSAAFGIFRGARDAMLASGALLASGGVQGSPLVGTRYSHTGSIPDITVRGVNVLPVGTVIRGPGRFLAAADTFFRSTSYAMSKNAIAYRMASDEGLTGVAFDRRVAEIRSSSDEAVMEQARGTATDLTLMGRGGQFVQAMNHLTSATINLPVIGEVPHLKFVNPFVNIAGQIINQSIIKRSPVGLLSPEIRADLSGKNGNVAQDMATARMLMGTMVAIGMGSLAAEGYASGSGPKKPDEAAMWRLAGNQPHSVRIGDLWYDVQKLGPIGMLMGLASDMYEVAHKAQAGEFTEAAAYLHHAIVQNILDQSFMKGPADLIQAIEDPERYGGRYVRNFLSSFVPYSNALAQATRREDPYMRQTRTVLDAIKAKIPGYSETLPVRRDIWGEPMLKQVGLGGPGVTAIYLKKISDDPVNKAMVDLGVHPGAVDKKIRNVELSPQQYDDYARIAGRMTKMRLDAIVRSSAYGDWPAHIKHDVIAETIKQCREVARGQVMMKDPSLIRDVVDAQKAKARGEKKKK